MNAPDFPFTDAESIGATLRGILSDICEDECPDCTAEGLLAKYEYACVETDSETGECVARDFALETGDGSLVSYAPGSYTSKEGSAFEPMTATFGTEYCTVYALVKAGRDLTVEELTATDGEVTASATGKYAISFVAFYCTEQAANDAAEAFPGGKRGRNAA